MVDIGTLAAMLAGQFGLRVVVANVPTFAVGIEPDGKPVLYLSSTLSGIDEAKIPEMTAMLRGALAHECVGHLRHTDMSIPRPPGLHGSFTNALEDIRIERKAAEVYPGAKRILADMVSELESDAHRFWDPEKAQGKENAILLYLLRQCRTEQLGQPLRPDWTATFRERAESAFGSGKVTQALDLAKQSIALPGTADVIDLARQIIDLLKQPEQSEQSEQSEQPEQPEQPEQSEQPDSDGPGEQEQQGDADAPGGAEESQEGSEEDQQGDNPDGSSEADGDGSPEEEEDAPGGAPDSGMGRQPIDESVTPDVSPEDYIKQVMQSAAAGMAIREDDRTQLPATGEDPAIPAIAHRLREALRQALVSLRDDEESSMGDRGRLHMPSLIDALAAKRTRAEIFEEDGAVGEGIDTALYLMVDQSGSMDCLCEFTRMTLQAIGTACAEFEGQGLEFLVGFFDDRLAHIKGSAQPWKSARSRVHEHYSPSGGTYWPKSTVAACRKIVTSRRRRKVLLTITDGDLGYEDEVHMAISTAKAAGIELAFVGIDVSNPMPAYLAFENASSLDPTSLLRASQTALLRALRPIRA